MLRLIVAFVIIVLIVGTVANLVNWIKGDDRPGTATTSQPSVTVVPYPDALGPGVAYDSGYSGCHIAHERGGFYPVREDLVRTVGLPAGASDDDIADYLAEGGSVPDQWVTEDEKQAFREGCLDALAFASDDNPYR